MSKDLITLCVLLGAIVYLLLIALALWVTKNRDDDTSLAEPIFISILLTPVIAIILEMLKPYKPDYECPQELRLTVNDLTDEQKAILLKELDSK